MRTRKCDATIRSGRLAKALRFADAAALIRDLTDDSGDLADAYVTLSVHAGIAAADVICCARLGEHAQGESHAEAIALLQRADHGAARHLQTLLGMKTKAGYSHTPVTDDEVKRAGRASAALLEAAQLAV